MFTARYAQNLYVQFRLILVFVNIEGIFSDAGFVFRTEPGTYTFNVKKTGKVLPRTGREGPEGE